VLRCRACRSGSRDFEASTGGNGILPSDNSYSAPTPLKRVTMNGRHERPRREVLVHVACGTFMLLEWIGTKAPADLYPKLPAQSQERVWAFVRRNDELEHGLREKDKVISLLRRALDSARETISRGAFLFR